MRFIIKDYDGSILLDTEQTLEHVEVAPYRPDMFQAFARGLRSLGDIYRVEGVARLREIRQQIEEIAEVQ